MKTMEGLSLPQELAATFLQPANATASEALIVAVANLPPVST
jgi:hypothetical protein